MQFLSRSSKTRFAAFATGKSAKEQHSNKPDVTRDKIVELAGNLPRVELFARQKARGWDVWGNEVDCDITLERRNEFE